MEESKKVNINKAVMIIEEMQEKIFREEQEIKEKKAIRKHNKNELKKSDKDSIKKLLSKLDTKDLGWIIDAIAEAELKLKGEEC